MRGGVLLMGQRGWLGGQVIPLINIQSPLTEGIIDRRFSGVGLQLLQFLSQRGPYLYAVGMGNERNPFARLLDAAGWQVSRVPFFFSVIHVPRFLREIEPLRCGPQKVMARIAAATGVASMAAGLWNLVHRGPSIRGFSLEVTSRWPAEVVGIWEHCRSHLTFCSLRDQQNLTCLYPPSQERVHKFVLRLRGAVVGWSAGMVSTMRGNRYFGNLTVGTILDGLSALEHLGVLIVLSRCALADLGADLIITNQTDIEWRQHLRSVGFIPGPSNYLMAISKPIVAALSEGTRDTESRIHVNRGDGDGRLNL